MFLRNPVKQPFLVTKYCANGNVMDYMRDFPEVNRLFILHEISSGMVYLQEKKIIHADLKAANILIGDDHKALICDFGLSHLKDQTMSTSTMHTIQGTLNYMAPEYLDGASIDYPADVYSFAMTAWQIYTGLVPFSDVPQRAFYRVVIDREERPEYPNSMSSALWALVQECWDQDPKSRPAFVEVEASLMPMVEPFLRRKRRQSLPINQMLAFSQVPTPPESEYVSPRAFSPTSLPTPQIPPVRAPASLDVIKAAAEDGEYWQPIERQRSTSVSLNSLQFFSKALEFLGEVKSLEKYQNVSLLSYPNWLKYHPYNTKTSRPQHVLKNRVKASIKRFNQALLDWVDRIPILKNVATTNVHRTALLLTGTCAMAEFTFRQNSEAPHQHVQEFINDSIKANAFRARVEELVIQALNQYKTTEDIDTLGKDLAQAVHEACG